MSMTVTRTSVVVAKPLVVNEAGEISGYVTTWTYQGDGIRFLPGSFDKSLAERSGKIPLMTRHITKGGGVLETVGWVMTGENDSTGLFIKANFLNEPMAQAVREKAKVGGVRAFSITARPLKYELKDGIVVTSEASFIEATLTNDPADVEAEVVAVREQPVTPQPEKVAAVATAPQPSPIGDTEADRIRRLAAMELMSLSLK